MYYFSSIYYDKKIYIDTSVFGGYFDEEFKEDTKDFFKKVINDKIKLLITDILELEIYRAPEKISNLFESLKNNFEKIDNIEEVNKLANLYIDEKVVGKTSLADCMHIAYATIFKADVLISWNFKHIVNLERIRGYNSVNFRQGYQMTEIRTPKEVFKYEDDE